MGGTRPRFTPTSARHSRVPAPASARPREIAIFASTPMRRSPPMSKCNALEAMAPVGDRSREMAIRTEPNGDGHVAVSVRDCGVGFAPAEAERLFDAFFTTKPDGMGMGLAVCRSIIEAHGGRPWAT
jgi:Histidine kinase-, DNA gyrase B-, and HSP90-like ATPase